MAGGGRSRGASVGMLDGAPQTAALEVALHLMQAWLLLGDFHMRDGSERTAKGFGIMFVE